MSCQNDVAKLDNMDVEKVNNKATQMILLRPYESAKTPHK